MSPHATPDPDDATPGNDAVRLPVSPSEVTGPGGGDPADLLGGLGLGGPGGFDLGGLLDMAGQMQQQLAEAQEEAAATVLEGVSGGGAVRVEVGGDGVFRSVTIQPDAVDPDDVEMLQDLVLAALNDAMNQVHELQAGAFGDPGAMPGLGGLGDLFGGLA